MCRLEDLAPGSVVTGVISQGPVSVINVEWHGPDLITLTYKDMNGFLNQIIIGRDREPNLSISKSCSSWTFDAPPELFRLVSEAKRIKLAYLFDPFLAVHTSKIRPLPHQITAVYGTMLDRQPLRFLLADDAGSGKTIMTGLLIKELIARQDVVRCLIVSPGGLAQQWQDELFDKLQLEFEIVNRDRIENSRTGNPFSELNLVIARLDQLSRFEDLKEKAVAKEWDLIVCDEAHKLSAHFYGNKVNATKRYLLGEKLRDNTRHFLLLTATPHNGKDEDFQLFLALLDKDRFEGKPRNNSVKSDYSDIMRRVVKEDLLTFEEKKLFPERIAYTKDFNLSAEEMSLYRHVTDYVKEEFQRAEKKGEKKKNVVGFALTILQRRLASSPEAIYRSIKRRKEKLEKRLEELQTNKAARNSQGDALYEYSEDDINDYDDNPDSESEEIEEIIVDEATASETIPEYEKEIAALVDLENEALVLRNSKRDSKWDSLRDLLENRAEMFDSKGYRRKLIIFTEHKDTLFYLANRIRSLLGKPGAVVTIHGGDTRTQRKIKQDQFVQDKDVLILVATDAAGEGINLQRANLMINYDLPWNPNRIEQRFGRIHRIGQTETCFLWNLLAGDTREGDVFSTLFLKLEEQRKALDGRVFDVLGKVFREKSLKDLLIEAIRYGEDPRRKAELQQQVKGVLDLTYINQVLKQNAIGETSLSVTEIQEIREEMERVNARKLQPHFIAAFFEKAFELLGGTITPKEKDRYEIRYVPAIVRQKSGAQSERILTKYERVCFDKELINLEGKPTAEFLCPGNPLFDSVLDLTIERYSNLLRQGSVLVNTSGNLEEPAILFYVEHEIDDERISNDGKQQVVSKQLQFMYYTKSGKIIPAGYAPYLDCRPLSSNEECKEILAEDWLKKNLEKIIIDYALTNIIPNEFKKIQAKRSEYIEKMVCAIKARLTGEIIYWDRRANELKEIELAGRTRVGLNSGLARKKADELDARMKKRLAELEKEKNLVNKQPLIVGGTLVLPEIYVVSKTIPDFARDEENRKRVELLAVNAVMASEKKIGRNPKDVGEAKRGWDIESLDPVTNRVFFIEVKGRVEGAESVIVHRNEILAGANVMDEDPQRYVLAIVEVVGDKTLEPKYIRKPPYEKNIPFEVTSQIFDLRKILAKAEAPI